MVYKLIGSFIVIISSLVSLTLLYEIFVINHVFKQDYHLIFFLLFGLFASILTLKIINKSK